METHRWSQIHLAVLGVSISLSLPDFVCAQSDAPIEASERLFVTQVFPLLREKCSACHASKDGQFEGGLNVMDRNGLLQGGDSGEPSIVLGFGAKSPLVLAVSRTHDTWSAMPPKESEKLSQEQSLHLEQWIDAGAPWPDPIRFEEIQIAVAEESAARGEDAEISIATSGGLSETWTSRRYKTSDVWAYQPIRKVDITEKDSAAIDALIALRMPKQLPCASPASGRDFLRRATLDLTGLIPTAEEIRTFEKAYADNPDIAVAAAVERLLASPHYGERMAQHWLDVVRYADSSGFSNDYERGNAWRYRDYVIRSFNADKPYNDFVSEQIAGDEIDPTNVENLIATGFLRMGPWELTGMEVPKIARQRFLDDVTNSVGETFLAHSLQCARCHDHKFDPVPTRDYYSVQAVFATTQMVEREAPFLASENQSGFEEQRYLELREQDYIATLRELDQQLLQSAEAWFRDQNRDDSRWQQAVNHVRNQEKEKTGKNPQEIFSKVRELLRKQGIPEVDLPPNLVGFGPQEYGRQRIAEKGLERLAWQNDRYLPFALSVYSGKTPQYASVSNPLRLPTHPNQNGELEKTCILTGGDPFAPGIPVSPGGLSAISLPEVAIPTSIEGRRKAFAQWVVHAENPLTARVIVNRIWMWHFGQAIAGNPNNFGVTGKKPTHPELLDWLASELIRRNGSIKAMHRLIMNSYTYRHSCHHSDRDMLKQLDPEGVSYAVFQPRRLTAEELRDSILFATGELSLEIGGIPCRPEMNMEVALQPRQVMGTFAEAWVPNPKPHQRHRRSIYMLRLRGLADPMFEVFNAPVSDFSCERREVSLVTPQVYSLFNSQQSFTRSIQLAKRAVRETANDDSAVIRRLFDLVYGRLPDETELQACSEHWQAMEPLHRDANVKLTQQPTATTRAAIEENTGERFEFEERLYANEDFQADVDLATCDARILALADVALVLLNSNEFLYVY
ncbi:MAG: PSD1 and planctomycete cytochrome C domain-containing protein [Pirellula sp.]|nr:PSD1 and planctomycete cytochrome C domain-containing protein [Pirellula sp.]